MKPFFTFGKSNKRSFHKPKPTTSSTRTRFCPENGWGEENVAIFDFLEGSDENLSIEACAGTGKTTTLKEVAYRLKEQHPQAEILAVAFGNHIAQELRETLPIGVTALTCHVLGKEIVDRMWGKSIKGQPKKIAVDDGQIAHNLAIAQIGPEDEKQAERFYLMQVMGLAKTRLAGLDWFRARGDSKIPPQSVVQEIIDIIEKWAVETEFEPERFAGYVIEMMCETQYRAHISNGEPAISFDDMVWLACVNGWSSVRGFDYILIDEYQDISRAREELILSTLKANGRVICFGDEDQAIFSFTGADLDSCHRINTRLNSVKLPLTTNFRCGKSIITKAQEINPKIRADVNAIDGEVVIMPISEAKDKLLPGDVLLSRINSPLVKLFFSLARMGKPVSFVGRDYWLMLQCRIASWEPESIAQLLEINKTFKLERGNWLKSKNISTSRLNDECDTIEILCNECVTVRDLYNKLKQIKDSETNNPKERIRLSSVHKFKGLEAKNVYVLNDTLSFDGKENLNISYVAYTRAREKLILVAGKP